MNPAKVIKLKPSWEWQGESGVEIFDSVLLVNPETRRYRMNELEAVGLASKVNAAYEEWLKSHPRS